MLAKVLLKFYVCRATARRRRRGGPSYKKLCITDICGTEFIREGLRPDTLHATTRSLVTRTLPTTPQRQEQIDLAHGDLGIG